MSLPTLFLLFVAGWLVVRWLTGGAATTDRANLQALEDWAVDELVELVDSDAPHDRAALRATLSGDAADPQVIRWATTHGVRAVLGFTLRGGGADIVLRATYDRGRREARRRMSLDALPTEIRARMLGGELTIVQPWRPAWARGENN